jgi:hypothetical protein
MKLRVIQTETRASLLNMSVSDNSDTSIAVSQWTDSEYHCSGLLLIVKLTVCVLWVWFSVSQFSLSGRSKAREALSKTLMSNMNTRLAQPSPLFLSPETVTSHYWRPNNFLDTLTSCLSMKDPSAWRTIILRSGVTRGNDARWWYAE